MALNLKKLAQKATVLAEIMQGKDKIDTSDIMKYYSKGITIDGAEKVNLDGEEFYVYTFKEDASKFAFSGVVLNRVFDTIMEACDGDIEVFKKELKQGLKVKLYTKETKDGNPVTAVDVL